MKGSSKWYWQRISAMILVPTSYWFVFFFVATFHGRLGLVTIYQDYFDSDKVKLYSRLTDVLLLLVILFILPIILI